MRSAILRDLAIGSVIVLCSNCRSATSGQNTRSTNQFAPAPQIQRSRDVLTSEEIGAKAVRTAYDAIVQLRPEYLKPVTRPLSVEGVRSKQGADELLEERDGRFPAVFLNGVPQGGPSVLRTIRASSIIEIRRFPATHVPPKYGPNHADGVLDVLTRP